MSDRDPLFRVELDGLTAAIRSMAIGSGQPSEAELAVMQDAELADENGLTPAGHQLFRTYWVTKKQDEALKALGQALRSTLPVQVIAQELNGYGGVPEDGVLDLMAYHHAHRPDAPISEIRPALRMLSTLGVIAYSAKLKTVRFIPDDPEAAKAGEAPDLAAMISPRTPFSNLARLRRVLRSLTGVVTWADPHFGARAFEELVDELDPTKVSELRIVSGDAPNVLTEKSFKDYQRFVTEMASKGIAVEWRVDPARDWHDRFLVHGSGSYNLPPVNNLFQGQYSEILPSSTRPPVQEWWDRSASRTA